MRALLPAKDWVAAADRQLDLARAASEIRTANGTVSLAASAAERFLKATLAYANRTFECTHSIDRLPGKVDEDVREALDLALPARVRQQLTDGGTVARHRRAVSGRAIVLLGRRRRTWHFGLICSAAALTCDSHPAS